MEDNHEILLGTKVHARWINELDQVRRVGNFDHLLYFLANEHGRGDIFKAGMGVKAIIFLQVEVAGGFILKCLGTLVSKELQVAQATLFSDVI